MNLNLAGQNFFVTGGTSGIGLATARLLIAEGAVVTISGRDAGRLRQAGESVNSSLLHLEQVDVFNEHAMAEAIDRAADRNGRLDGVAAIAGRGQHGSVLELSIDDVVEEISAKVRALLNLVRPAIPHLVATGGRIVSLTAPSARDPLPAMGAVSAARSGVASITRSIALELAPVSVRANAVGVGLIDTHRQIARHEIEDPDLSYQDWLSAQVASRRIPLARAGEADEVARAVCWLLSDASGYTTGSVIDVSGGHVSS